MIPFSALACLVERGGVRTEASLEDLSAISLTLRLRPEDGTDAPDALTLRLHGLSDEAECTLPRGSFTWTQEAGPDGVRLFRAETLSPAWRALAGRYMREYSAYTQLKTQEGDAVMSQTLLGYNAAGEEQFFEDFSAQRRAMLAPLPDEGWAAAFARVPDVAIALSSTEVWTQYLAMPRDRFAAWYWCRGALAHHPVARSRMTTVLIGSAVCPLLCPDADTILRLAEKAEREGVTPVITLAPVSEGQMDEKLRLLSRLAEDKRIPDGMEIVLNDWGMLAEAGRRFALRFSWTLGTLLQKRRKDVRMALMQGFGGRGEALRENALNADFFLRFVQEMGVSRASAEACGYPVSMPEMPVSLHLPFYQMNTAPRCTLRAVCEAGDRGAQTPDDACPHWCRERSFLYPAMLNMAGRYNTLYGLDEKILTDGAYLAQLVGGRVDRVVVDLL